MSQDGTIHRHRRLGAANAIPAAADALTGELLVNIADGRVYTRAGDDIADVGIDRPYATRAAAAAATIPASQMRLSLISSGMVLRYIRDASGTALTTADGATWSPDGPEVYPEHWKENTTPGTTDMASAFISAHAYSAAVTLLPTDYLVSEPILSSKFFARFICREGLARVYAAHTSGPVFHFRKSYYELRGVQVFATAARTAATYDVLNAGVITGDFNWTAPTTSPGSSGAWGIIEQNSVDGHPGPGVLNFGSGGRIAHNDIRNNKGHGVQVDTGNEIGVAAADLGFPGWSKIELNKIENNGGHAIALGHPDAETQPPYRYWIANNDCGTNATDASVRRSTHQYWIKGEQIETFMNVAGGNDTGPGFFVAGRQHRHRLNRTIELNGEAYEIGDLSGYSTEDLIIDGFRVNSPLASLNPAVKIASTITPSNGVKVIQGSSTNITNLVASADRGKYAMVHYKDELTINGPVTGTAVQDAPDDDTSGRLLTTGASATVLTASPVLRTPLGGTANAITLTTGASLTSVPTGMLVRFRATAANTGATTINLDGTGAVAARTITGVALPADYIRTDVDTEAYYDGTNWIVRREIERRSKPNGEYVRYADGTQICWHKIAIASGIEIAVGGMFMSDSYGWTFPAAFAVVPTCAGLPITHHTVTWSSLGSTATTTTSTSFRAIRPTANASTAGELCVTASGRWF